MSDRKKNEPGSQTPWVRLDPNAIDVSGQDEALKLRKSQPDFSQFKTLYDNSEITAKERFKRLYEAEEDSDPQASGKQDLFKSIHRGEGNQGAASPPEKSEPEICEQPGIDLESLDHGSRDIDFSNQVEQARKDGYARGMAQGEKDGYDQGFQKGLAAGQEQGRKEGEEKGYEEGAQRGETEARERQDEQSLALITSLETILLKTEVTWEELVKRYEGKMISLIARIAEKVVQARVKIDKGVVRQSIVHALELLPEPEEIVLQVSEEDYEYIDMIKEDFFERIKSLTSISVVANSGVKRGGCKIESATARVETDVESRLQAVLDAIVAEGN